MIKSSVYFTDQPGRSVQQTGQPTSQQPVVRYRAPFPGHPAPQLHENGPAVQPEKLRRPDANPVQPVLSAGSRPRPPQPRPHAPGFVPSGGEQGATKWKLQQLVRHQVAVGRKGRWLWREKGKHFLKAIKVFVCNFLFFFFCNRVNFAEHGTER